MTRDEMRREVQKLGDAAVARAKALGAHFATFTLLDEVDGLPVEPALWRFKVRRSKEPMFAASWVEEEGLLERLPADIEESLAGPPFTAWALFPATPPPAPDAK